MAASHGITRTIRTRTEEQRVQDLERISKYRGLEDEFRSFTSRKDFGPELFQLTSKLLRLNPEYYTVWNARRRSLISGSLSRRSAGSWPSKELPTSSPIATTTPSSAVSSSSLSSATPPDPKPPTAGKSGTTAEVAGAEVTPDAEKKGAEQEPTGADGVLDTLKSELNFTIPLLIEYPKCYWIWNHRTWILQKAIERLDQPLARRIWEEELGLVAKMLTKDRRNFHAWTYRRHVVAQLESRALGAGSLVEPEFEYTTKMIRVDLSNFSAWHNRTRLIPRLLNERGAGEVERKTFFDAELGLIREALNVGPEDQSLWYYHQFLMLNLLDPVGRPTITPDFSLEERVTYVSQELEIIKELLEDYEDTKWIYEVLLEYTLASCQLEGRELEVQEREDIKEWLAKLMKLDPMRSGRWVQLEKDCGLLS